MNFHADFHLLCVAQKATKSNSISADEMKYFFIATKLSEAKG